MASVSTSKAQKTIISKSDSKAGFLSSQFISEEDLSLAKQNIYLLPEDVRTNLQELETAFQEGEVTEKGFNKKCAILLSPHLPKIRNAAKSIEDEEYFEPPLDTLPSIIREQLDELERELKDEEITIKGYTRKREKILSPFMLKEPPLSCLPKVLQKSLEELQNEFREGDLTDKGYRKRRAKLLSPYLVKANGLSTNMDIMPMPVNSSDMVTVVMPSNGNKDDDPDLAIGIQIMNGNEKLFKCQLCNEVFKQAQSFSGHCRLHRTGKPKAFKCTVCKASYTTRSHLKFHMFKHTGNYPFTCEFCGKGFAGRSQYRYHTLRHTGQSPYICKDCGGRFWKKRNLDAHCDRHRCDDAPVGLQKCAHCHAMFETLDDLQTHMYVHDDEVEQAATMVTKIKQTPGSLSSESSQSGNPLEDDEDQRNEEIEEESKDSIMEVLPFEEC